MAPEPAPTSWAAMVTTIAVGGLTGLAVAHQAWVAVGGLTGLLGVAVGFTVVDYAQRDRGSS